MSFWESFLADQDYQDEHQALLASVQHQLTCLLESEAPLLPFGERLPELDSSNLRYGVDCLQSISSQINKDQLASKLANWIKAFEPRLKSVSVEVFDRKAQSNSIEFSLLATLQTGDTLHSLVFDSNISLANQKVDLEGQDIV